MKAKTSSAISPAPWTMNDDRSVPIYGSDGSVMANARYINSGSQIVAHVLPTNGLANARAICAVPELISALQHVAAAYQQMFDVMPVAWQSVDDEITALLAKVQP